MISAQEARKLTEEGTAVDLSSFETAIKIAASEGLSSIQTECGNLTPTKIEWIQKRLEKFGYLVKRESGYDQRDGRGWDYLTISW